MLRILPTQDSEVRLVGEIDMSNADRLATRLTTEREKGSELTLDLSEVTFMDSSGLKVLLDLSRSRQVRIIQPSDSVSRLLRVTIPHGVPGLEVEP
jgi:anti-sigma B factor antagonist